MGRVVITMMRFGVVRWKSPCWWFGMFEDGELKVK
jgi:hypothetical protein